MSAHDLIVSHGHRATSTLMIAADAVVLGIISTLQLFTHFSLLASSSRSLLLLISGDVAYSAVLWERSLTKASINPALRSCGASWKTGRQRFISHSICVQNYLRRGAAAESCSAGGVPVLWSAAGRAYQLAQARSLNHGCAISGTRKGQSEHAVITCEDRWAHLMLH